jgi:malonyl-CoA/methylmalonyl-CoA synthetase
MSANLFDRFERSIADPSRSSILSSTGEPLSYAGLVAWSGRLANAMAARGVKPGDRVAVQVEKSVAAISLYLATLRAGAIYLPLNTAYTVAELDYFIGDAEPKLMVCDPARREAIAPIVARIGGSVETLDAAGRGTLSDAADGARLPSGRSHGRERISRRSSTPQARRADPRERC